ncbi:unnamed protein product [Cochlearia groenlandica]
MSDSNNGKGAFAQVTEDKFGVIKLRRERPHEKAGSHPLWKKVEMALPHDNSWPGGTGLAALVSNGRVM